MKKLLKKTAMAILWPFLALLTLVAVAVVWVMEKAIRRLAK